MSNISFDIFAYTHVYTCIYIYKHVSVYFLLQLVLSETAGL